MSVSEKQPFIQMFTFQDVVWKVHVRSDQIIEMIGPFRISAVKQNGIYDLYGGSRASESGTNDNLFNSPEKAVTELSRLMEIHKPTFIKDREQTSSSRGFFKVGAP